MKKVIVQFSSINALMAGLFDGVFSVGEVKEYGDFGLGMFTCTCWRGDYQ
jgi:acetolactate decarboxylase